MKTKFNFLMLALMVSIVANAQLPKTGAIIKLSEYNLEMVSGETANLNLELIRSVRFQKGKIDGFELQEVSGFSIKVVQSEENSDKYLITLEAMSPEAGTFPLIIKATGNDDHQVRSAMVMVTVKDKTALATTNQ